ncbi:MAG: SGNH/GDSL hydrolase family protein [Bacteroidetes bacterium]|nr:SGNH/GDSL hydrolase family protein [Bacteroidota bacterium]
MKSTYKILILFLSALSCLTLGLLVTQNLFDVPELISVKKSIRSLVFVVGLFLFWAGVYVFHQKSHRFILKNTLTVMGGLLSIFVLLEIVFTYLSISCGGSQSLVSKNWFAKHWGQNRYGFRDWDPKAIDRPGKPNIFIVGDSYVAGHGIDDTTHRFSNIMRQSLQTEFDVFNLGICGADTKEELQFVTNYPVKADYIVVAHTNNDIYRIFAKSEIKRIFKPQDGGLMASFKLKPSTLLLVSQSFALNFFDYVLKNILREKLIKADAESFSSFELFLSSKNAKGLELNYYRNDKLFQAHVAQIGSFVNYANQDSAKILFLLFPKIDSEVMEYTNRTANLPIANYLTSINIDYINLTPVLRDIPEQKRVVSRFDPHPGIFANRAIADTLVRFFIPAK